MSTGRHCASVKPRTPEAAVTSDRPLPRVVAAAVRRAQARNHDRSRTPYRRAVVAAIRDLGPHAYAFMILQHLTTGDRPLKTTIGALHATLKRMQASGLLIATSAPSPVPGARSVIVYALTDEGRTTFAD